MIQDITHPRPIFFTIRYIEKTTTTTTTTITTTTTATTATNSPWTPQHPHKRSTGGCKSGMPLVPARNGAETPPCCRACTPFAPSCDTVGRGEGSPGCPAPRPVAHFVYATTKERVESRLNKYRTRSRNRRYHVKNSRYTTSARSFLPP